MIIHACSVAFIPQAVHCQGHPSTPRNFLTGQPSAGPAPPSGLEKIRSGILRTQDVVASTKKHVCLKYRSASASRFMCGKQPTTDWLRLSRATGAAPRLTVAFRHSLRQRTWGGAHRLPLDPAGTTYQKEWLNIRWPFNAALTQAREELEEHYQRHIDRFMLQMEAR